MTQFSGWKSPGRSNPNLLTNWDFRNPVNQRGQEEYNITVSKQYTIDMVRSFSNAGTLNVEDDHIIYTGNGGSLYMPIEQFQDLQGKKVTASIAWRSEAGTAYCGLTENGSVQLTGSANTVLNENYVISSFTVILRETLTSLGFRFGILQAQPEETKVYVQAVKLETGPISTLAYDLQQPSNKEEQLRLCQRYLQVLDLTGCAYSTQSGESAYTVVPVTTAMRTTPSVINSEFTVNLRTGGQDLIGCTINAVSARGNGVGVNIYPSSGEKLVSKEVYAIISGTTLFSSEL